MIDDCRLRIVDSRIVDSRLRLPIADCRLNGLEIADCDWGLQSSILNSIANPQSSIR